MATTRGELFAGVHVAIVTPLKSGEIDWDDLGKLVDWHIEQGTDGLVPCGTTGESPTLDHDEHERVVAFVCERACGRLKVMAGTGSNSTREAIRMTRAAKAAGAHGTLQVGPYYNKPTQEGYFRHFGAIADACDLPSELAETDDAQRLALDVLAKRDLPAFAGFHAGIFKADFSRQLQH